MWQAVTQQGLQGVGMVLLGQVMLLWWLIQLYRPLCLQAVGGGVEELVVVEWVEELGMQLVEWECGSSNGVA